jgi:hypothetical protein
VESVPAIKLKRAKEDLNMNQTRDADIVQLKAQSSSAFNTLPFQLSQLTMDNNRIAQPSYRASQAYTNTNTFLPQVPTTNSMTMPIQLAAVPPTSRPARGIGSNLMGWRGNPFSRASLTRAQVLEKVNVMPQMQADGNTKQMWTCGIA